MMYYVFIDLAFTEHGEKKIEALKKINSGFRGGPVDLGLPEGSKPVN